MQIINIILLVLSALFFIALTLPLIRNDHWTFRVFEFPRLQKMVISLLLLTGLLTLYFYQRETYQLFVIGLLGLALIYLFYQIAPFLPIAPKQVASVGKKKEYTNFDMLISNVYQYNEAYDKLVRLVNNTKPDLVMLVETNEKWKDAAVSGFGSEYPYQILKDLENTYGMLLFSKLKLKEAEVRHLISKEVPSIKTKIVLPDEQEVMFYGIHPEPPVPSENPKSTARDAEILLCAREIKKLDAPVFIAGDLNDVAWSYTTELFLKVSDLLDPRRGRGFFNTFHAKYSLLRWPLDHIFCSHHFCVKKIERMPTIDSDHFPMHISLSLTPNNNSDNEMDASEEEKEQAAEKVEKGTS